MEFNEKLQELRKNRGLTQEDLAQALYVSRTAVSKWESARGYPSIDSLKSISKLFSVSIDELLSTDEILYIAQEDTAQKENHFRDIVFGLLDIACIMFFFIPLFGQKTDDVIYAVSVLSITEIQVYLKYLYIAVITVTVFTGIIILTLQNFQNTFWQKNRYTISLIINITGTLIFIISSQPYAAVLMFVFLLIKIFIVKK